MVDQAKIERFMRRTFPDWYSGYFFRRNPSYNEVAKKLYEGSLARIAARHPELQTVHGVLLAEILRGTDYEDRTRAAFFYGMAKYRRGFERLAELELALEDQIAEGLEDWATPHSKLRGELLTAFGYMDTAESHALLKGALERWSDGWQQSQAIDGMAFEEKQFEPGLVLPFITLDCHPHLTKCAIYALMSQYYYNDRPAELAELVSILQYHKDPGVKEYVIMLLESQEAKQHRSFLVQCLEDESESLRTEAQDAIEYFDRLLETGCELWRSDDV